MRRVQQDSCGVAGGTRRECALVPPSARRVSARKEGDVLIGTNTFEGYSSILKRGINGVYHHVSQQHLKRYLCEFDFRHNERMALGVDDKTRALKAVKGVEGKRLTYRQPCRISAEEARA